MGKTTGFLEFPRKNFTYQKIPARIKNYREFMQLQPEAMIQTQGARCMDCGIAFCHTTGCPVFNLIPEWNDLVYRGRWKEAYERLELTNNLPEITGRVCPAPCETSCTLSINTAPVTIKQIELAIIEKAFREGWVIPRPPVFETGRRVAVIGSGPAGLSAAQQLRRMGHQVVLFERSEKIGGLLRYGIPDYKLDKSILDRRLSQLTREGVIFETEVVVGEDISARYLKRSYNAVVLAMGSGIPRDLDVPGRDLEGVDFAMEYLSRSNKFISGDLDKSGLISAKGKNVLVIGGGDTGSDCIGTAIRQGARKIHQVEILPKPREWDKPWNPEWPDWPNILRTSTSHQEGCDRRWSVLTKKFEGASGKLKRAHCVLVDWQKDGSDKWQMTERGNSDFELDVDLAFLAMGFVHVEHGRLLEDLGVEYGRKGDITVSQYATNVPGVFAAGDSATGASLVVRAINHGRRAAAAVNRYLQSL